MSRTARARETRHAWRRTGRARRVGRASAHRPRSRRGPACRGVPRTLACASVQVAVIWGGWPGSAAVSGPVNSAMNSFGSHICATTRISFSLIAIGGCVSFSSTVDIGAARLDAERIAADRLLAAGERAARARLLGLPVVDARVRLARRVVPEAAPCRRRAAAQRSSGVAMSQLRRRGASSGVIGHAAGAWLRHVAPSWRLHSKTACSIAPRPC